MTTLILSGTAILCACDSVTTDAGGNITAIVNGHPDGVYPADVQTASGITLPTPWPGTGYTYANGVFTALPATDAEKQARCDAVDALCEGKLIAGFTVPSNVSVSLAGKVLQTRDNTDRTNWLASHAAYSSAIAGGQGAAVAAKFRSADNITVTISIQEGFNVLLAMESWGASIMSHGWDLKDAIRAAADRATFDAIDITTGWPS